MAKSAAGSPSGLDGESCLQLLVRRWGVSHSFMTLFVVLFFFFYCIHESSIDRLQRPPGTGELVAFSASTNGASWTNGLMSTVSAQTAYPCGWASVYTPWYGVYCDPVGKTFFELAFSNNNLQGAIRRDCLFRLVGLEYVQLGGNPGLSGEIPQLPSARQLDIHRTGLGGPIPFMARLEILDISETGPNITALFAADPLRLVLALPELAFFNMSATEGPIPDMPLSIEEVTASFLLPVQPLPAPDWRDLPLLRRVNLSRNQDEALLPTRISDWFRHELPLQNASSGVEELDVSFTNFYGGLDLRSFSPSSRPSARQGLRLRELRLEGSNVFPLVMTRDMRTNVDAPAKVRFTAGIVGNTSYLDTTKQYFSSPTRFHKGPRFGLLRFNDTALTFYGCGVNQSMEVRFDKPTFDAETGVFDGFEHMVKLLQASRCASLPDPLGYFEFDPQVPCFRIYDRFAQRVEWKSP